MVSTSRSTRRYLTALPIVSLTPTTERSRGIHDLHWLHLNPRWVIVHTLLLGFTLGGFSSRVFSAVIEANIEQDGVVISDASGFAELSPGESATVSIYLVLQNAELASSFEAGFDLSDGNAFEVSIDLGRVDPNLVPLGVGTWTATEANIVADQVRISLLRENQGGESLVADIVVTPWQTEGIFDVVLVDRGAAGDLGAPPFFIIVPIGTATGTILATIAIPEPQPATQWAAVLFTFAFLKRVRARWRRFSVS